MARNYLNYKIYHEGYSLALELYKIADRFPANEQNNMISQIKRAAVSIPVNIVEGSAKKSSREFLYFLNTAYGSAKELAILISLSKDIGYIKKEIYKDIYKKIDEFNKKIFLFIRSVEKEHSTGKYKFFQKFKNNIK